MSSSAFDVTAMVKALEEAVAYIGVHYEPVVSGKASGWNVWDGDVSQTKLLDVYDQVVPNLERFPELQAWARKTAEEINAILAKNDFTIRLDPWTEEHQFGVVAIYDLLSKWLTRGAEYNDRRDPYTILGKPAYRLSQGACRVQFWDIGQQTPLIRIPTQIPGDFVCLVRANKPLEQFELLEAVAAVRGQFASEKPIHDWDGVVMPNILFDQQIDISWLKGLWCLESESRHVWKIVQALMQVKYALGPEGGRGKVAAAAAASREAFFPKEERNYVVDHDMLYWIERKGFYAGPLLTLYFRTNDFADRVVSLDEI